MKSTTKQSKQNTVLCLFCVSLDGLRYHDSTVNEQDCMYIRTSKAATVKPLVSDHSKFQDRWLVRRGTVYLSVRGLKIRYKIKYNFDHFDMHQNARKVVSYLLVTFSCDI